MTPFIAELIGSMLLLTLGCGVVANVLLNQTNGHNGGWIVITTGWALAVYVGVIVASPYSGAHLNPAVSIGLAAAGRFPWASVPAYILAQLIGSMIGAMLIAIVYRKHFDATTNPDITRAVFCTSPAIRHTGLNLFSELMGTFVLVFSVLFFTDASLNDTETVIGLGSLGALPVALVVWSIGLSLGGTTGYAINPTRDLGARLVHALMPFRNKGVSDWAYSWVPIAGPIMGAVLAALLAIAFTGTMS